MTADELYRRIFTVSVLNEVQIGAAFFTDSEGKAIHVAGYCGKGLFMNVSSLEKNRKGAFRTMDELKAMYPRLNLSVRSLKEDYGYERI